MGQVKRKKKIYKQPNLSSSQPSISYYLLPLSPKEDNNPLASLNPFEPLHPSAPHPLDQDPDPHNIPPTPLHPLWSQTLIPLPPPPVDRILTRKQSKEAPPNVEYKKNAGRKTNKELRDEAAAKEMALGMQQPMETFIGRSTRNNEKSQQRGKGAMHHPTSK